MDYQKLNSVMAQLVMQQEIMHRVMDKMQDAIQSVTTEMRDAMVKADRLAAEVQALNIEGWSELENARGSGFDPLWKDGNRLTEAGVKALQAALAKGATSRDIQHTFRMSVTGANHQIEKYQQRLAWAKRRQADAAT